MRIYWSIVMAGVLSVSLLPERGHGEEIIRVHGCAPGWIELGTGDNTMCIADPSWSDSGGGGWGGGGGGENGGGGGGAGGANEPQRHNAWDDATWEEAKRQWRCSGCKVAADKCISQARLAETTCTTNAKNQAAWRCDIAGRKLTDGNNTVTAWGCSIDALRNGLCGAAEAPWNQPWRWNWECSGGGGKKTTCTGAGIDACKNSWAESHPEGSTQVVDSGTFSVMFEGIGGSGSKTVTATYQLSPLQGYLAACSTLGTQLATGCTVEQNACYNANKCTGSP